MIKKTKAEPDKIDDKKLEQCNFMLPLYLKEVLRKRAFDLRITQRAIVEYALRKYLRKHTNNESK